MIERLDTLIPEYALNKKELDSYKKLCGKENAEIKDIMKALTLTHYETDDYKATVSTQQRDSVDEKTLIEILKESPELMGVAEAFQIIKTKEYIDFDALENAIYKNKFTQEELLEMNAATTTKEVVTLKVTQLRR